MNNIDFLKVAGVWILNFLILLWDLYAVGTTWTEAKHAGGWMKFVVCYVGTIILVFGWSWQIIIVESLASYSFGWLNLFETEGLLYAGYLIVLPAILFSSYALMFDSWARTYREHSFTNLGVAAWNSYATIHNTYNAVRTVPEAIGKVMSLILESNSGRKLALIVFLLLLALAGGTIITGVGIWYFASRDEPLPLRS